MPTCEHLRVFFQRAAFRHRQLFSLYWSQREKFELSSFKYPKHFAFKYYRISFGRSHYFYPLNNGFICCLYILIVN